MRSAEFAKIAASHDRCFWLDGGGSRDWSGRRSLFGWLEDDDLSLTFDAAACEVRAWPGGEVVGDDIFAVLGDQLDGDPDTHWVGYFGYAARPDLPARPAIGVPDAVWMRAGGLRMVEHDVPVASDRRSSAAGARGDVSSPPDWYAHAFAEVQSELRAGNSYEVNLTYRLDVEGGDPVSTYLRLRKRNPAPYAGYLQHLGTHLLSSSPERFATIDRNGWMQARPIKGTTPRGATPEEDDRLRELLATDPKLRAENLMITDLLRNDLAMVCRPGTVSVPQLMVVETYASVHQLVSTIRGRLREDVGSVEALRAIFPAGSMTGAPKLRTMEIIDRVESTPRGIYAGAFGWISGDGRADLGVVIRSLIRTPAGAWHLGTGGGITVRSDVDEEWAETCWKAERLR